MSDHGDEGGTWSAREARAEAERHRRDLAQTLAQLSDRITSGVADIEQHVTRPLRWAREHPLATLGLGVTAGLLLAGGRRHDGVRAPPPGCELEGAYLLGRRDESEQRPLRDPAYWASHQPAHPAAAATGDLLWTLARPLLHELAAALSARLQDPPGGE